MYKQKTLIDFSTILYSSLYLAKKEALQEDREIEKKDIFSVLFNILNRIFSTYNNCYVVFDGRNSNKYRREIYPEYKRNRDSKRDDLNIKLLFSCIKEIKELFNYYPIKVIEVNEAEADDVIYCLCERYHKESNILVLTSDKDLIQLMNYFENVEIYNMFQKKYFKKDPLIVEKKIIVGDKADNISGISRVGIKTFDKMMQDKNIYEEKIKGNEVIIEKFRKIIDLRLIPERIKNRILNEDETISFNKYDPESIEFHFYTNQHKKLLDSWSYKEHEINH